MISNEITKIILDDLEHRPAFADPSWKRTMVLEEALANDYKGEAVMRPTPITKELHRLFNNRVLGDWTIYYYEPRAGRAAGAKRMVRR